MTEYIEREEALKILENMRLDYENSDDPIHTLCEDYVDALETAENKLNMLIAADVRPERHGHWITRHDGLPFCSECDYSGLGYIAVDLDYCPKCGAKMDGKDNDI